MLWRARFVYIIYAMLVCCYVLQVIVLTIYVHRDGLHENPVHGDDDPLWLWYYGSNFFCFFIELMMIFLFYKNFIKFTIELSKNIHGIRINLVRIVLIFICMILIICKAKSHIAMPIIVDIYYYQGDVIWSFITDSFESCTAFLTIYDYIWAAV